MRTLRGRLFAKSIVGISIAGTALLPKSVLACWFQHFVTSGAGRGERILSRKGSTGRVALGAIAPFTIARLEAQGREFAVRMLPLIAWFKCSIYYRVLSREQLYRISSTFTEKVEVRVVLPAGLSLPVGFTPGVAVEATGAVLEWMIDRYLVR